MEITWYGHSCFRLTERNMATVVTDPFDNKSIGYSALKLKSDIVTVSHDAPGHNNVDAVKGASHVIDGAGEFEIGGVFVTGVSADGGGSGKKKSKDGSTRNTIYVFDYDGITVAHLGDLKQTPTQSEIESLGTINFHTTLQSAVTSKISPPNPVQISVLPFARRCAPDISIALNCSGSSATYVHAASFGPNATPSRR